MAMPADPIERFLETVRPAATDTGGDPQSVLHATFDAVVRGDYERLAELLTDDAELSITGFGPIDGNWRGRDEVVAGARRNYALLASQQPEIDDLIVQGDRIAVLMRENGVLKSNGQAYSVRGVQWFAFHGGKIRRIDQIIASIGKVAQS
jgi:ketosteroid isomerase-like protein